MLEGHRDSTGQGTPAHHSSVTPQDPAPSGSQTTQGPLQLRGLRAAGGQPQALTGTGPSAEPPGRGSGSDRTWLAAFSLPLALIQHRWQPSVDRSVAPTRRPKQSKAAGDLGPLRSHGTDTLRDWGQTTAEHYLASPIRGAPKGWSRQVHKPAGAVPL